MRCWWRGPRMLAQDRGGMRGVTVEMSQDVDEFVLKGMRVATEPDSVSVPHGAMLRGVIPRHMN